MGYSVDQEERYLIKTEHLRTSQGKVRFELYTLGPLYVAESMFCAQRIYELLYIPGGGHSFRDVTGQTLSVRLRSPASLHFASRTVTFSSVPLPPLAISSRPMVVSGPR